MLEKLKAGRNFSKFKVLYGSYDTTTSKDVPIELVQALVSHKSKLNITTIHGFSPLMVAVAHGDTGLAKTIAERRPDLINTTYVDGRKGYLNGTLRSPMHLAAKEGKTEIMEILLQNGGRVDLMCDGLTPLHVASSSAMAELLLKRGANINSESKGGMTPLMYLSAHLRSVDPEQQIQTLMEFGANVDKVHEIHGTASDMAGKFKHKISFTNESKKSVVGEAISSYTVQKHAEFLATNLPGLSPDLASLIAVYAADDRLCKTGEEKTQEDRSETKDVSKLPLDKIEAAAARGKGAWRSRMNVQAQEKAQDSGERKL